MALTRELLETQLQRAEKARSDWEQSLTKQGLGTEKFSRDPVWRGHKADIAKIKRRLKAVAEIASINAEVAARKAEKNGSAE